jgi:hypothetical protein
MTHSTRIAILIRKIDLEIGSIVGNRIGDIWTKDVIKRERRIKFKLNFLSAAFFRERIEKGRRRKRARYLVISRNEVLNSIGIANSETNSAIITVIIAQSHKNDMQINLLCHFTRI